MAFALILASIPAIKAETYGDLIVGFTKKSGTDYMLDLGSSANLTNGSSWNLSAALSGYTLSAVNWGVAADAMVGDHSFLPNISTAADTLWSTTPVQAPPTANESTWGFFESGINSILGNFPGGPYNTNPGDSLTIAASDDNSWYTQTINGSQTTDIVNSYVNPNIVGVSSGILWQTTADNSAPVPLGVFNLSSSGILTFSQPTPKITSTTLNGRQLVVQGTGGLATAQYRILSSTNLVHWVPVKTNTFLSNGSFSYTCGATNAAGFYRVVTP